MESIPDARTFLLKAPPYQLFQVGQYGQNELLRLRFFEGTLDLHCMDCGRETVFRRVGPSLMLPASRPTFGDRRMSLNAVESDGGRAVWPKEAGEPSATDTLLSFKELAELASRERTFELCFHCTRDDAHRIYYCFRVFQGTVSKIGQSPSMADLHAEGVKKYRSVLGNDRYRELTKAIGLNAHGIGIGAFVYLRRVFESLISDARRAAAAAPGWDEDAYGRGRMDDKVKLLRDNLPAFLVENRHIYSILSSGVHELSEDRCLEHFETLRTSIELILDEEIERRDRTAKVAQAKDSLGNIKSTLTKP